MRDHLAPFGSTVWDPEGERLLILRVPGLEPDVVNHVEEGAEYVGPEIADARALMLLADRGATVLPLDVLRQIVQERRVRDREFGRILRPAMAPGEHRIMAAPGDARRSPRLILRLGRPQVHDAQDADWDGWAKALGPKLDVELAQVRFVHIIADGDDVRLDADLVLQDLSRRASDEEERRRLAAEAAEKLRPQGEPDIPPAPVADLASFPQVQADSILPGGLGGSSGTAGSPPGTAPSSRSSYGASGWSPASRALSTARIGSGINWEPSPEPSGPFDVHADLDAFHIKRFETDPRHRAVQEQVDARVGPPKGEWVGLRESAMSMRQEGGSQSVAQADVPTPMRRAVRRPGLEGLDDLLASHATSSTRRARTGPAPRMDADDHAAGSIRGPASAREAMDLLDAEASSGASGKSPAESASLQLPGIKAVRDRLERSGYDVMVDPPLADVVLAAERERHPARVLVYAPPRLDLSQAKSILTAAKTLDADLALVVCTEADGEARERLIATRAKFVPPEAVPDLVLA